jgi:DNA polymerase elongation subunit (family B)
MSYVDAYLNRDKDTINIVERIDGKRVYKSYPTCYRFYYDHKDGPYKSIYGRSLDKFETTSSKAFQKEKKLYEGQRLYESDLNPVFRCLEENYLDKEAPDLHVALFDIEVDFDKDRGFARPDDPHQRITAVTLHLSWLDSLITLCLAPKDMPFEMADSIAKKFENTVLCETEAQLLNTFLHLIEDADILSGWNSEGFDIPYIVNRTEMILSKDDVRRFSLWDLYPRERMFTKFGNEQQTYDFFGRVHLDYLELYRKYTYHEMHSYRLDAIGEYEIGEKKIPYEGTLDQLYNEDFEKFIAYNRQDVALLAKLDKKLKFIDLSNVLAHANTVLLQTTMGAVAVTEQAIVNESHKRNLIIPDRKYRKPHSTDAAVGAYVATPKKGLHDWIGAIDINSLYPSVIRCLNMGPETIIGQLRPTHTEKYINDKIYKEKKSAADAWEGLFGTLEYTAVVEQDRGTNIIIDFEDGTTEEMSGAELYAVIFQQNDGWCLSANGTIFNTQEKAIIPGLLERWFAERKVLQGNMKEAIKNDDKDAIAFWDKRQLVKKINLNSLYGAILNPGCRFFDHRIGQSVTLTGRTITKHMASITNEIIAGEYDHKGKSIVYGDTDSVYFSAYPMVKEDVKSGALPWSKEAVVELYDNVANEVNKSFPTFMQKATNVPIENGKIIVGGREMVASKGLFITKKRYAVLIYDLEGNRQDVDKPGKLKAMGLDLKRSDTPEFVQNFLSKILIEILTGKDKTEILSGIQEFKRKFGEKPGWEKGTPKRVNNLTKYVDELARYSKHTARVGYMNGNGNGKLKKPSLPGHVRASINWNKMREAYRDLYSLPIMDGQKVIVCKLKPNPMNYTSIAYPIDELNIPKWFKELPFDHDEMEKTIIDQKVSNLMSGLGWDLESTKKSVVFDSLFEMV